MSPTSAMRTQSSFSPLKTQLFLFRDSQNCSHSSSRLCKTTLFAMETMDLRERTTETRPTPKVLEKAKESPNQRKGTIVTTTISPISLVQTPRTTMTLQILKSVLEKEKVVRQNTNPPTRIGIREMTETTIKALVPLPGGPTTQMIGRLLPLRDQHRKAKDQITPGPTGRCSNAPRRLSCPPISFLVRNV